MSDDDRKAVLAANSVFYEAFAARDVEAMEDLWSRRQGVACIHPGWPALDGREAVLESWRGILEGESPPKIECVAAAAYVYGDAAFAICVEELEDGHLVATNFFVREEDGWRMVHHQAGPAPGLVPIEPTTTLH